MATSTDVTIPSGSVIKYGDAATPGDGAGGAFLCLMSVTETVRASTAVTYSNEPVNVRGSAGWNSLPLTWGTRSPSGRRNGSLPHTQPACVRHCNCFPQEASGLTRDTADRVYERMRVFVAEKKALLVQCATGALASAAIGGCASVGDVALPYAHPRAWPARRRPPV